MKTEPSAADYLGGLGAPASTSQVVVLDEIVEGSWWVSFGVNAIDRGSAIAGALQLLRDAAGDEGLWIDPRPQLSAAPCRLSPLRRPG